MLLYVPVFVAAAAVLVINESLYGFQFIALALVLAGIGLSEYSGRE